MKKTKSNEIIDTFNELSSTIINKFELSIFLNK